MENVIIRELARRQIDIYNYHDARSFDDLARCAGEQFVSLGIGRERAGKVGKLISDAYRLADCAESASKTSRVMEDREYGEVAMRLREAALLVGVDTKVADCQARWWKCFRHKNLVGGIRFVFRQHFVGYSPSQITASLLASRNLVLVGLSHKRRDYDGQIRFAEQYWRAISVGSYVGRIPYLG